MAGEGTTVGGIPFAVGQRLDGERRWRALTMELDKLRLLTRDRLQCGELPRDKCQVTWFGPGIGERCAVCQRSVTRLEIECECEQSGGSTLRFHQACFAIWDEERQQLG